MSSRGSLSAPRPVFPKHASRRNAAVANLPTAARHAWPVGSGAILIAIVWVHLSAAAEPPLDLLSDGNLQHFRDTQGWHFVEEVHAVPGKMQLNTAGAGGILVNSAAKAAIPYLYTREEFADVAMHLEFMVPEKSNSGVYLQGRYEIQILDSYGVEQPRFVDLGGLYERWDEKRASPGYSGVAPRVNAARPPGAWQTLDITFRGPRFDDSGRKIESARFVLVRVNGQVVHEDQEASGPTREARYDDEQQSGPIVIQGDHGPIAIRRYVVTRLELD